MLSSLQDLSSKILLNAVKGKPRPTADAFAFMNTGTRINHQKQNGRSWYLF
jgi:hypothetical protein